MMNKLGNCVMYHDTDSIIYTYKSQEWIPSIGEYLGDLMDELSCSKIGCKGEVVCKVHGFSLNYFALQIVNLDSVKDALISWKNKIEKPEMVTIKTMIL